MRAIGRIKLMHNLFGVKEGKQCRTCVHLRRYGPFWKCKKHGITSGKGSDWRLKWTACGLHEEEENET